ncbi:uncharacterized protein LOC142224512 [Haematobia irritans]|uniref:uncharacterized protein LOC142224512 n=1 Tax=Haematobia irritans TaxID=7368 RepID=UPI003F50838D
MDEIKSLLVNSGIKAFGVSETWLKPYVPSKAVTIPWYSLVRNDRSVGRGGGVGIYVSSRMKYKVAFRSNNSLDCESLFLDIQCSSSSLLFGVVYIPHGRVDVFERMHSELLSRFSNIIIVGDFNCNLFDINKSAHMRSIGSRLGMNILHKSCPTHFDVAHDTCSLIDYVMVSDITCIKMYDQAQCPAISHHAFIFGCLSFPVSYSEEFIEYRDYRSIDWDGFFNIYNNFNSDAFFFTSNVDMQLDILSDLIRDLFSFVPLVRKRKMTRTDTWLDSSRIRYFRSLRDIAYREYLRCRSDENWRAYCVYRNKTKSVMRSERRRYYCGMFSRMDDTQIWSTLRSSGCLDDDDCVPDIDVNYVNDFFVSNTLSGVNSQTFSGWSGEMVGESLDTFSFNCVFGSDIEKAMNSLKPSSVGVDGIPVKFLKIIFPYISCLLLHLFNSIILTCKYPDAWKVAKVVPVPKSKGSFNVENLRPISILPSLSKLFEYVVRDAVQEYIDDRKLLNDFQYGFRHGISTASHLLHLTDAIRETIGCGEYGVLVGLDLSRAFDRMNHSKLIQKLRAQFHFSDTACRLISSYLSGRSQFVSVRGVNSEIRHISSGVPQGSVLGPLLFILYVNDIFVSSPIGECFPFLYADDIHLFFSSTSTLQLEMNINHVLEHVSRWVCDNDFVINNSKSRAMFFYHTNTEVELNIKVNGYGVPFVTEMRCLGVVLDRRLSFEHHVDSIFSKVMSTLRRLYSLNLFMPVHIRKRLGFSLLMSSVNYCIEVVSGANLACFSRLQRIVNMIVRHQ